ncbi:MAG: hypothetical protein EA399_16620 [Desulfovibrionales bacterium]|nr:MAG: hypothetical protein EA399_16620 [Desulfovibrionales bacterium]
MHENIVRSFALDAMERRGQEGMFTGEQAATFLTMVTEIDVIRDITQRLEQIDIPYMLTGSIAMNYYAEPRMTRDIDIVVELGVSILDDFFAILEKDYYVPEDSVKQAIRDTTLFNIIHKESVIKVDFIVRKNSEYRILEFKRRKQIHIGETPIHIVSKEDLILSKMYWTRESRSEMQKKDILNLMKSGYNEKYVEKWALHLNVMDIYMECTHG